MKTGKAFTDCSEANSHDRICVEMRLGSALLVRVARCGTPPACVSRDPQMHVATRACVRQLTSGNQLVLKPAMQRRLQVGAAMVVFGVILSQAAGAQGSREDDMRVTLALQ